VEQIVAVWKRAEVGRPVAELLRQVGISEQTLYGWKTQSGATCDATWWIEVACASLAVYSGGKEWL